MAFKLRPNPEGGRDDAGRFAPKEKLAAPLAQVFRHAVEGGETITEAGEELGAPDFEASGVKETRPGTGADHIQAPAYLEEIPWERSKDDPPPFKLR